MTTAMLEKALEFSNVTIQIKKYNFVKITWKTLGSYLSFESHQQ